MTIYVVRTLNVNPNEDVAEYEDRLGIQYHYDSNVGNSRAMVVGDVILVRGNGGLLGISRISEIVAENFIKEMRRCVGCGSTELSFRTTTDDYRCNICKEEFSIPHVTGSKCVSYTANYRKLWQPFRDEISIREGDLDLSGYRTNAIRKVNTLSCLVSVFERSGQGSILLDFLSSPNKW